MNDNIIIIDDQCYPIRRILHKAHKISITFFFENTTDTRTILKKIMCSRQESQPDMSGFENQTEPDRKTRSDQTQSDQTDRFSMTKIFKRNVVVNMHIFVKRDQAL